VVTGVSGQLKDSIFKGQAIQERVQTPINAAKVEEHDCNNKCAHEKSLRRKPNSITSSFLENNYLNFENLRYVENYESYYVTEKTYNKL
jgi:hypothetical protein